MAVQHGPEVGEQFAQQADSERVRVAQEEEQHDKDGDLHEDLPAEREHGVVAEVVVLVRRVAPRVQNEDANHDDLRDEGERFGAISAMDTDTLGARSGGRTRSSRSLSLPRTILTKKTGAEKRSPPAMVSSGLPPSRSSGAGLFASAPLVRTAPARCSRFTAVARRSACDMGNSAPTAGDERIMRMQELFHRASVALPWGLPRATRVNELARATSARALSARAVNKKDINLFWNKFKKFDTECVGARARARWPSSVLS